MKGLQKSLQYHWEDNINQLQKFSDKLYSRLLFRFYCFYRSRVPNENNITSSFKWFKRLVVRAKPAKHWHGALNITIFLSSG